MNKVFDSFIISTLLSAFVKQQVDEARIVFIESKRF